jgi:hypothetical protein
MLNIKYTQKYPLIVEIQYSNPSPCKVPASSMKHPVSRIAVSLPPLPTAGKPASTPRHNYRKVKNRLHPKGDRRHKLTRTRTLLKRKANMNLSVVLASPLGTLDEVDEGGLGFLPATGLETTVL